jgi:protein-S-isoprenylcysteine O-methyltransferase Ste14
MPLHSYFAILAFILCGIQAVTLSRDGSDLLGKPTIEKFYFYTSKIAIFTSWTLFLVKAILPKLGYIHVPVYLSWIATVLLWIGSIVVSVAFIDLGRSLKVGLPQQETMLKTRGIYRFSRNPIYSGVHLIAIASCLYFPDLINVSCTIYGIYIHHKIIKGEEHFLARRFGKEWDNYCTRVRRYL